MRASVCPDGRSPEVALTPHPWLDDDYVLDSCSERDFDDHRCSKTNELFLVVIDGWAGRSELTDWTTFSCSLTEHAHAIAVEVNLLLGQPFPVH